MTFAGGTNFYTYVTNNPLFLVDPFGLKGKGKPSLPPPPFNPLPDAISKSYDAYEDCVDHNPWKDCEFETPNVEPFPEGGGDEPGPADFGVSPDEGTVPIPSPNEFVLIHVCGCLQLHSLAALDPRFNDIEPGDCF
jgi:hypothetical protein